MQEIHSNGNVQTVLLLTTVGSLVVGGDVGACCLLFNVVRCCADSVREQTEQGKSVKSYKGSREKARTFKHGEDRESPR
jgi:hypothetical protein